MLRNHAQRRRERRAWFCVAIATVLGMLVASASSWASDWATADGVGKATPADPANVIGNAACVKCHASEQSVWASTPHAKTFDELHRRPEAAQIASKLGITSIKHGDRCIACHYTLQAETTLAGSSQASDLNSITTVSRHLGRTVNAHAIAGISCESCHGAARDWIDAHHDYRDAVTTRLTESPAHRESRIAKSVSLGMRNPHNVYLVAQSCYRCHTTGDEELVNVGGHPAGSLDFEVVSWSQGTIQHNFVRTDGKQNVISSPNRLRFLFVAGVIADTEASFRALSKATEKANYAVTVAKRAARAGARLRSVADKVGDSRLAEAVTICDSVAIKLNNADNLNTAADRLAEIGVDIAAAEADTNERALQEKLILLDRFIPDAATWK